MADNGNKVVVLNTRERVLSTDANRAQTFYGQGVSEVLRFLLDASCDEDRFGGGFEVMSDGTEVPPRGYVVNGIRPQPVNGTSSLFVTPGVVVLVDNPADPNTDDSVACWVVDPGVSTLGLLTLPANVSGMTIIGVVECQRTTVVLEQDNRDVFNVVTGLFSPILVNKVTAGRLVYRIRLGAPGGGFPGVVAGWTPLTVFNQPAAATTWDDVLLMWDVRTLADDRWNAPFNTPRQIREEYKVFGYTDLSVALQSRLFSQLELSHDEERAGGRLGALDPNPASSGFFDLLNAANQTGSHLGFLANSWWYVYALFPFGLARWQLYSTAATAAPRRPIGPRGIPAITRIAPFFAGVPSVAITTPTATGLADPASQSASCLTAGKTNAGSVPQPVTIDGHVHHQANFAAPAVSPSSVASRPAFDEWTLTEGVEFPGAARVLYVVFSAVFTLLGAGKLGYSPKVTVGGPDGTTLALADCFTGSLATTDVSIAPFTNGVLHSARIPLPPASTDMTNAPVARVFKVRWQFNFSVTGAGLDTLSTFLVVSGWELGP